LHNGVDIGHARLSEAGRAVSLRPTRNSTPENLEAVGAAADREIDLELETRRHCLVCRFTLADQALGLAFGA